MCVSGTFEFITVFKILYLTVSASGFFLIHCLFNANFYSLIYFIIFNFNNLVIFYSMNVLPACTYVYHMLRSQKRALDPPGTEVTGSCEPPCGYWNGT